MKNILFISPTGTIDNGAEISIFYLMKYLVNQNFKVYAIAPQFNHPDQIKYFDLCKENDIYVHFIPSLKWWWEDAPGGSPGTKIDRAYSYRDNIKRINEFIKTKKIDLVISNTVNVFQGAVSAACMEIPHYWLIHEFPEKEFKYYRSKIGFIEEYSDKVYSVYGELHENLQKLFDNTKIKTFIPYSEIKAYKKRAGKMFRVVSVGRVSRRKNQLELLKAFSLLKMDQLELVFIGGWEDDYKSLCDEFIKDNEIKNVIFTGNVDNPWSLITDKDICVLPSSLETFGLVYVEALLEGVPVLISDNPGFISAFDIFNYGVKYPLGDLEQLAGRMKIMLENFDEYSIGAENFSRSAREMYTVEKSYNQIIDDIEFPPAMRSKSITSVSNIVSTNLHVGRIRGSISHLKKVLKKIKL